MKRNQILGLKLLSFSLAMPVLIFFCAATGLVSYLAFSILGAAAGNTDPNSGPVRIRTIPELELVAPAPITNEPDLHLAGVIEEVEPEPVVEIEAPPIVEAPAPVGPVIEAEIAAEPPPVEEARSAPAPVPTQDEAAEPTETIVSEAAPLDTVTSDEDIAVGPENGPSSPDEDLSMVEAPAEPIIVEPVQPVIAANPAPLPQKEPAAPAAPSEPTFVPDSSFFDQLLEQVD